MASRKKSLGVTVFAVLIVAAVVIGAFWFNSGVVPDEKAPSTPPMSASTSAPTASATPSLCKGYQPVDLFEGDPDPMYQDRLTLLYKKCEWQNYPEDPTPGVRKIVLNTHCDLATEVCPTLTFTDLRSPSMKERGMNDAPIINVLNQQKCPVGNTEAATKFEYVGKQNFGDRPGVYYRQTLCKETPESMVKIMRHVWVSTDALLMVEMSDTKQAQTSDIELADVKKVLSGLAKRSD